MSLCLNRFSMIHHNRFHILNINIDTANGINYFLKLIEVDLSVSVNFHVEVLFYGIHHKICAAPVIGVGQKIGRSPFRLFRRNINHNAAFKGDQLDSACFTIERNKHRTVRPADIVRIGKLFVCTQQQNIDDVFPLFLPIFRGREYNILQGKFSNFCLSAIISRISCRNTQQKKCQTKHYRQDSFHGSPPIPFLAKIPETTFRGSLSTL